MCQSTGCCTKIGRATVLLHATRLLATMMTHDHIATCMRTELVVRVRSVDWVFATRESADSIRYDTRRHDSIRE
jgi:hypothetical protein